MQIEKRLPKLYVLQHTQAGNQKRINLNFKEVFGLLLFVVLIIHEIFSHKKKSHQSEKGGGYSSTSLVAIQKDTST